MSNEDLFALVSADDDWRVLERKTSPEHTGQRLKANEPLRYEQCRRLLDKGVELLVIADCMEVGVNTLYAIIEADLGGQAEYNKTLADRFAKVANLGAARMIQLIPHEKSLVAVSMATGVAFDKMQAAKGAPGLVVEHRVTVHQEHIDKINAMVAEAQERLTQGRVVVEAEETPAWEAAA